MMMMELPEEEQGQTAIMLGGIANGTYRLRTIIESMIDISMIDTQVLELGFQRVYLRNLTKMAIAELADVVRIRQIRLETDEFPEDGAQTFGDPERLHQALFNVVGNAIKYTPDGRSIHIKNTFHPPDDQTNENLRGFLDIQVIDSGIGIAPQDHERIFEKFSGLGSVALHSTGKYKFKGGGAGLGLAITRGIIEAHGGKIWVESPGYDEEKNPGSTFHILLPLLNAPPHN
jgi:signal transduction histidine kinase